MPLSRSTRATLISALLACSLLACASTPRGDGGSHTEDASLIDQLPIVPLPQVQALRPDDLAPQQARLSKAARRLLDGRFEIASQRLFVLDETGADWVAVQNFVGGHIEKQWQGQWLDAPASNEEVHARVWRSGQSSGYVALIRLDDRSGSRRLVFGYFALTKTADAPEDRPNPKAALFGQAPSGT